MFTQRVSSTIISALLIVLLSACGPAQTPLPPTATPPPTLPPPTVTLAPTQPPFKNTLVYDLPEMYQVNVKTVQYQPISRPPEMLDMNVYYPPDWQPGSRLPAVIFANDFPLSSEFGKCGADCDQSWGRLVAANGLIAVTYATQHVSDIEAVVEHIRANTADLGIDGDHLGIMGASANAHLAGSFAYQENRGYIRFAVFYYSSPLMPDNFRRDELNSILKRFGVYGAELPDVKQLRSDLRVLIVRAGQDSSLNREQIDHFVQLANEAGVPLTLIKFDEGSHLFDGNDVSSGQVKVKAIEIIKQTLEFMKTYASGQ